MLSDEPRPGNPGEFTPSRSRRSWRWRANRRRNRPPITHWTAHELADEAQKRGIVASISASQVNRYLNEAKLQPHRSRYWLNTKEKERQFQEKVEAVCDCYHEAPRLYAAEHTHTVCTDEMTGIQALERIAATCRCSRGAWSCGNSNMYAMGR